MIINLGKIEKKGFNVKGVGQITLSNGQYINEEAHPGDFILEQYPSYCEVSTVKVVEVETKEDTEETVVETVDLDVDKEKIDTETKEDTKVQEEVLLNEEPIVDTEMEVIKEVETDDSDEVTPEKADEVFNEENTDSQIDPSDELVVTNNEVEVKEEIVIPSLESFGIGKPAKEKLEEFGKSLDVPIDLKKNKSAENMYKDLVQHMEGE